MAALHHSGTRDARQTGLCAAQSEAGRARHRAGGAAAAAEAAALCGGGGGGGPRRLTLGERLGRWLRQVAAAHLLEPPSCHPGACARVPSAILEARGTSARVAPRTLPGALALSAWVRGSTLA